MENGNHSPLSSAAKAYVAFDFFNRLIFAPVESVDMIWASIASASLLTPELGFFIISPVEIDSLVSGPLHSTAAYLAKVATSPKSENPSMQHTICIYFPNVYDEDEATKVISKRVEVEYQQNSIFSSDHENSLTKSWSQPQWG